MKRLLIETKLVIKCIGIIILLLLFVRCSPQKEELNIVVGGHVYGKPNTNKKGIYPSFFRELKKTKEIDFAVFTGDIVAAPTVDNWQLVIQQLKQLSYPVFFAPGNHDMGNRPLYDSLFGNPDTLFYKENCAFILFDNTKNGWGLDSAQINLLNQASKRVENIFVFMHNVVWQDKNKNCFNSNSQAGKAPEPIFNYWIEVEPKLKNLANSFYLIAGDVGATLNSENVGYLNDQNIHYITSGMGNGINDNFLKINIGEEIMIDVVNLRNGSSETIESYKCSEQQSD